MLIAGEYTIVQVFVCLMTVTFGAQGAGQFFSLSPDLTKATLATANVTRLLDHEPDIDIWSQEGKRIDQLESGNIEFRNVYFAYPSRFGFSYILAKTSRPEVPVLRGLDFVVRSGQYVALVGESGCGKSTILSMLERFYDPEDGLVLVDGIPVSEYRLSDYRRHVSIVSQEPTYAS